jgi:hypothetical protein
MSSGGVRTSMSAGGMAEACAAGQESSVQVRNLRVERVVSIVDF